MRFEQEQQKKRLPRFGLSERVPVTFGVALVAVLVLVGLVLGAWLAVALEPDEPPAAAALPTLSPMATQPPALTVTASAVPAALPGPTPTAEAVPTSEPPVPETVERAYRSSWAPSMLRMNLAENYPRFYRRPHFTLYYQPGTYTEAHLDETLALVEESLALVEASLGATMEERFEVLVAGTLYARPNAHLRGLSAGDINQVYVLHDGTGTDADNAYFFAHELAHLVAAHVYGNPEESIMLSEGLATWAAMPALEAGGYLPAGEWCAAMDAAGMIAPLVDIETDREAFKGHIRHPATYFGAGCFTGYLIDTYGLESFREVYTTSAYTTVYGKTLAELDAEWRATLAARWAQAPTLDAARLRSAEQQVAETYAYVFYHYEDENPVYYEAYLAADRARVALWKGDFEAAEGWVAQARRVLGWGT